MRKIKFIFIILLVLILKVDVKALCDENTLLEEAELVKVISTPSPDRNDLFYLISIENVSENLKVEIKNTYNNETASFDGKDKYAELVQRDIFNTITYDINIYSNDELCSDNVIRNIKLVNKSYNKYSTYNVCINNESNKLCDPFYDASLIENDEEFFEEYNKIENENTPIIPKTVNFFKKYYLYFIVPLSICLLSLLIEKIILKKKGENIK